MQKRGDLDNQKVQITFQTISRPPDGGEKASWESPQCHRMESNAIGEYYAKGDAHYCLYEEQPEGWEEPYKVMLKWKGNALERQIRGKRPSRMVFEPGKGHCDFYHTPYGELLLETETHRLEITEEQDTFFLVLEYGIKQDGQLVSENLMEIRIIGTEKKL